jgi:hypothetical protein
MGRSVSSKNLSSVQVPEQPVYWEQLDSGIRPLGTNDLNMDGFRCTCAPGAAGTPPSWQCVVRLCPLLTPPVVVVPCHCFLVSV